MSFISSAISLPSRFISYFIPESSNSSFSDALKASNIHPEKLEIPSSPLPPKTSTKPHEYQYPRPNNGEFVTDYLKRIIAQNRSS